MENNKTYFCNVQIFLQVFLSEAVMYFLISLQLQFFTIESYLLCFVILYFVRRCNKWMALFSISSYLIFVHVGGFVCIYLYYVYKKTYIIISIVKFVKNNNMMRKLKRKTKLNKIKQTDLKFFFFIISFFLFFLSFFYNSLQKFNLHTLIYFFLI